jgi:hypothetical protein
MCRVVDILIYFLINIMFQVVFSCLLILILLFVVAKLYKINNLHFQQLEKFVSDFDEVMDNKCSIETNFQTDNYLFSGTCIKNTCETERCDQLICDDGGNECNFMYSISPKTGVTDSAGHFSCVSKEDVPNNVYCGGVNHIPVCDGLGTEDFCYEFDDHDNTFERQIYKKQYNKDGNCVWMNQRTNLQLDDEDYLVNCRKEPLDCSLCNLPCASLPKIGTSFLDNYQKYILRNDDGELSCIPDTSSSCFECDEGLTKQAYRLISNERRFETVFYTQNNVGGVCVYLDGDGNCHPDHNSDMETIAVKERCSFETDMFSHKIDCTAMDYRFCCNLDERDFFEKTKYEPILSRDGSKCVYVTVDGSLDRELLRTDDEGFNCPGYNFRLCQNSNEYRNVAEQKCTPCPEGKYLKNKQNFRELTACEDLPDCSGPEHTEYCFENQNETGTIQTRRLYQQQPRVTYYTDEQQLPTASCVSTAPSDCQTECENGGKDITGRSGITDIYCDLCPVGQNVNPNTFRCETVIDCPSDTNVECLNRHENTIYTYNKQQADRFSPCMYVNQLDQSDKIEPAQCTDQCPPQYVRDTDDKCVIPKCIFERELIMSPSDASPVFYSKSEAEKLDIFNTLDTHDVKFDSKYCNIDTLRKTISVRSAQPSTVCQVNQETIDELIDLHLYDDVNVSLGDIIVADATVDNARDYIKNGADGDCPKDCQYDSTPISFANSDTCIHRSTNNVRDYYIGDQIRKGSTQKKYRMTQDQVRFGKSCDNAKLELYSALNIDSSKADDTDPNTIIVNTECDLPKRDTECITYDDCQVCEDKGTCEYKQECVRRISQEPFGDPTPVCDPPPENFTKDCPNKCLNCEDTSVWVLLPGHRQITESEWNTLVQASPEQTQSISYSRQKQTTVKCMHLENPLVSTVRTAKNPGVLLGEPEVITVNRPSLTQNEIDTVCNNESNYDWYNEPIGSDCSCFNNTGILQNGISKVGLKVRGIDVSCIRKTRIFDCDSHYTSPPCTAERERLEEDRRLEQVENTRQTYCSDVNNWTFEYEDCPQDDCYPGGTVESINQTPNIHSEFICTTDDITNPYPTKTCPRSSLCVVPNISTGYYKIKILLRKYIGADDTNNISAVGINDATIFYINNIDPWNKLVTLKNTNNNQNLTTQPTQPPSFSYTTNNEASLKLVKVDNSQTNHKMFVMNPENGEYNIQISMNEGNVSNANQGFSFEEITENTICNDVTNYELSSCPVQTQTHCGDTSTITGVLKTEYSGVTCPSSITPPTRTCPCIMLADGYYRVLIGENVGNKRYINFNNQNIFKLTNIEQIAVTVNIISLNSIANINKYMQYDSTILLISNRLKMDTINNNNKKQIRITQEQHSKHKLEIYDETSASYILIEKSYRTENGLSSNYGKYTFEPVDTATIHAAILAEVRADVEATRNAVAEAIRSSKSSSRKR